MITSLSTLAPQAFAFLGSYGLRCVFSNESIVRWESESIFVQIRYDGHRSHELALEIGQLESKSVFLGPPFTISEIVGMVGHSLDNRPFFQVSVDEELETALDEMARLLILHGKSLLRNDDRAFAELAVQRRQDCDAYEEARRLKWMRDAADKAWQQRDFKAVVELYGSEKSLLTPAESKRYGIALKTYRQRDD